MKWCERQLIEKKRKVIKLKKQGLKTIQVINFIKALAFPMFKFPLKHSNLSLVKFKGLDSYLRKLIN
jgi:hypothetical protein